MSGLHLQTLHAGDRLPSIRDVAREWSVDARTVRAGYQQLERDGLVRLHARSGVYVTAGDVAASRNAPTGDWMIEVLLHAREHGVPPIDHWKRVAEALTSVRLRAACVECNHDQMSWLEHETARDYGLDSFAVDLVEAVGGETEALRGADFIVSTAFHQPLLQRMAAHLRKPLVLIRLHHEFVSRIAAQLARGPLYFVVADERFAAKLPQIYATVPGVDNLRPVVAAPPRAPEIPDGGAVMVTRAAERKLGAAAPRSTIMRAGPNGRVFCRDSAAALLRTIIALNARAAGSTAAARTRG